VNIILFSSSELTLPLPRGDARARHILEILRRSPGEQFDAGIINGPRGKGTLVRTDEAALQLSFVWDLPPPPLPPLHLIIGLPRPQTGRDILREGAALGVASMDFVLSDKGEPGYARSTLWSSREWESLVIAGASQAFCTHLPLVTHGRSLADSLAVVPAGGARIALDNYEASRPLGNVTLPAAGPVTLALGPERGWSEGERCKLRQGGFQFAHLGARVLRVETACVTAVAVIKTRLGLL